jgi:hypothetical protein
MRGEVDWRPDEGDAAAAEEEDHGARPPRARCFHSGFATATAGREGKSSGFGEGSRWGFDV